MTVPKTGEASSDVEPSTFEPKSKPGPTSKSRPKPKAGPADQPAQTEQDRLREVNDQLRRERELAGKRREQDLRRRR